MIAKMLRLVFLQCGLFALRFEDSAPPGGYDCVLNTVDGDYDTRSLQATATVSRSPPTPCIQVVKQGGHFSQVMRNVANPGEWIMGARCKFLTWTGEGGMGKKECRYPRRVGYRSTLQVPNRTGFLDWVLAACRLMAEGKMKPVVNTVLPLNQINEAHNMVEKGVGRGKVLVKMVENVEQLLEGVAK
eukprot:972966-Pelagomonas_calceolata.AAC.3